MPSRARRVLLLVAGAVLLGCGERAPTPGADASVPVRVVATTARAARLAESVGAGRAEVRALVGPEAQARGHVLTPQDAEQLRTADLVVRSGGALDDWVLAGLPRRPRFVRVVTLADEEADPGWWRDERGAIRAVGAVRGAYVQVDPAGIPAYARAAAATAGEVRRRAAERAPSRDPG